MFCGHIGAGLVGKKLSPGVPVGALIAAAFLPDILGVPGMVFPKMGRELVPWTHGLLMCGIWAVAVAVVGAVIRHELRGGLVLGLLVLGHWVLDFVAWPVSWPVSLTGRLPILFAGSPEVGLGLYSSVAGFVAGEVAGVLFVGVMIWVLARRAVKPPAAGDATGPKTVQS
jgi:hypothetical protein